MKLQTEREEREMEMRKRERELENERKKAEAKEELRELEMAQKRGSSRASRSVADDIESMGSSKKHEFVDDWTRNLPKQQTPPPQPHTPEVIIDHPQTKTKEGAEDKRLTTFFTFPPTFTPMNQQLPLSNHNLRETVALRRTLGQQQSPISQSSLRKRRTNRQEANLDIEVRVPSITPGTGHPRAGPGNTTK